MSIARNYGVGLVALCAAGLLSTVYVMEFFFDAVPCQLCLYQRYAYFGVIGVGAAWATARLLGINLTLICSVAALVFVALSGGVALYQMGVEAGIFTSSCSGGGVISQELFNESESMDSLLKNSAMPPCDQPYIVLGLSLSTWNFVASSGLVLFLVLCIKSFLKKKDL